MGRFSRRHRLSQGLVFATAIGTASLGNSNSESCSPAGFTYLAPASARELSVRLAGRQAIPQVSGGHDRSKGKQRQLRLFRTRKQYTNSGGALDVEPAIIDIRSNTEAPSAVLVGRMLLRAGSVVAGLVALLYITSAFEALMHSASGILSGKSVLGAGMTGIAVGTLHTVAGPDHLAGLAPLVVGQGHSPASAFGLGALWGSGHATGQLLIGMACLLVQTGLLRLAWTPALDQASGILVGASLVAIGALGFREAREYQEDTLAAKALPSRKRCFGWATYATGVLHGLSPDALLFIAPALALPRIAAVSHVAGVVAGTLLAMGGCTACLSALCRRSPRLKTISGGASSIAVLLGACILAASLGFSVPLPGL